MHLVVNQQAFSPRLGLSFYWPRFKLLFHASYDRVFQTPAIENLLLASSPAVATLSSQVLRLPVEPSRGNFYEVGITKALADHVRLNVNAFRRAVSDFADDDVLLNTGVGFRSLSPVLLSTVSKSGWMSHTGGRCRVP